MPPKIRTRTMTDETMDQATADKQYEQQKADPSTALTVELVVKCKEHGQHRANMALGVSGEGAEIDHKMALVCLTAAGQQFGELIDGTIAGLLPPPADMFSELRGFVIGSLHDLICQDPNCNARDHSDTAGAPEPAPAADPR